jgi:hypothetical protein
MDCLAFCCLPLSEQFYRFCGETDISTQTALEEIGWNLKMALEWYAV